MPVTTLEEPMSFLNSELVRVGHFRAVRTIGLGACGQVYAAIDNLGRTVAVKEALPAEQGFAGLRARFRNEARIQAALQHPNIIAVHQLIEEPESGETYLVCEYADGGSLADRLHGGALLSPAEALLVARDLCAALEATWARQIVHRDIKPSNILLQASGGRIVRAKLADFGVAQDQRLRRTTLLPGASHPGTPLYMAPEQTTATTLLDVRADIYALGAALWEALTGEDYKLRATAGAAPGRPELAPALAAVLARALAEDRAERYQRPQDLARDLELALHSDAAPARATIALGGRAGVEAARTASQGSVSGSDQRPKTHAQHRAASPSSFAPGQAHSGIPSLMGGEAGGRRGGAMAAAPAALAPHHGGAALPAAEQVLIERPAADWWPHRGTAIFWNTALALTGAFLWFTIPFAPRVLALLAGLGAALGLMFAVRRHQLPFPRWSGLVIGGFAVVVGFLRAFFDGNVLNGGAAVPDDPAPLMGLLLAIGGLIWARLALGGHALLGPLTSWRLGALRWGARLGRLVVAGLCAAGVAVHLALLGDLPLDELVVVMALASTALGFAGVAGLRRRIAPARWAQLLLGALMAVAGLTHLLFGSGRPDEISVGLALLALGGVGGWLGMSGGREEGE